MFLKKYKYNDSSFVSITIAVLVHVSKTKLNKLTKKEIVNNNSLKTSVSTISRNASRRVEH